MPRGGRRVGSGRKPKGKAPGVVLGMDGSRLQGGIFGGQAPQVPADPELETPPGDLTQGQRKVWRELAPLAVSQQTLVSSTVGGFRLLCRQWERTDILARKVEKLGAGSSKAIPFHKELLKLEQRLDASLARFKLTAFGKAADQAATRRAAAAANPWAEVAR